ncbi:hypothetical protein HBDW_25490 [Herbaspirillum sp. DW155]|uniref:hypothetical protein n=1 Tax=Herbaspirillum sp. DW155 TaxID=3095609 RepID=UPI003091F7A2|nr:hypothetical protein HBDW_25490 [Herbaspirillum sp. DW155]
MSIGAVSGISRAWSSAEQKELKLGNGETRAVQEISRDWMDSAQVDVAKLPEAEYQQFVDLERQRIAANEFYLRSQYTDHSAQAIDSRLTSTYATVSSGGRVIATIDNQGTISSDYALSDTLQRQLAAIDNGRNGPDYAARAAALVASVMGGVVSKAGTALTQSSFEQIKSNQQNRTSAMNTEGMEQDELLQQILSWRRWLSDIAAARTESQQKN